MRRTSALRALLGSAAAVLAVLVAAAGCGSPSVVTRPVTGSPSGGGSSAAPSGPARAQVGDTVELRGTAQGARMAVTVTSVVDPANPANDIGSPSPGRKLVAVQFRLRNTGSTTYSDAPSNGAEVVDDQGQGFNATVTTTVTSGQAFPAGVHLAPGDSALGFVVFDLPVTSRPARVQFTLDSGLADRTGQWSVPATPTTGGPATPAGPTTTVTRTAPAATTAPGARQVVEEYYAAIDARDYRRAWDLGGRNLSPSYRAFVAGFAGTAADTLTVTGARGDTVDVVLDALGTDGSHRFYTGSYTVRGGVIVAASLR
ncbi:DUF4352 domain-containing protein [Kitasatospora paranensis]|uniref:DUF4352 domain-containing protein n=1 Tax=Kitasatospora paranensis TaxID=258053 RepID=A0ABW2G2W5_9ACTN